MRVRPVLSFILWLAAAGAGLALAPACGLASEVPLEEEIPQDTPDDFRGTFYDPQLVQGLCESLLGSGHGVLEPQHFELQNLVASHDQQLKDRLFSDLELRLHQIVYADPTLRLRGNTTTYSRKEMETLLKLLRDIQPHRNVELGLYARRATQGLEISLEDLSVERIELLDKQRKLLAKALPHLSLRKQGLHFYDRWTIQMERQRLASATLDPNAFALLQHKIESGEGTLSQQEAVWILNQLALSPPVLEQPGLLRLELIAEIERDLNDLIAQENPNATAGLTEPQRQLLLNEIPTFLISDSSRTARHASLQEIQNLLRRPRDLRLLQSSLKPETNWALVITDHKACFRDLVHYYNRDYLLASLSDQAQERCTLFRDRIVDKIKSNEILNAEDRKFLGRAIPDMATPSP